MFRKNAFLIAGMLFAPIVTSAPAGNPVFGTNPSLGGNPGPGGNLVTTVQTVTSSVNDVKACLVSSSSRNTELSSEAFSYALSNVNIGYSGDVVLDLTRQGMNGSVSEVNLAASMQNGTVYAQVSDSSSFVSTSVDATARAEIEASASLIAQAYSSMFQGIDVNLDLAVVEIRVKAGTYSQSTLSTGSNAYSESDAIAYSEASSTSGGYAQALSSGDSSSGASTNFHIKGTNISEFTTQMNLTSGALTNVQTTSLARSYADALATSYAYSLASASVSAQSSSSLTFQYNLPIIGSGSLPIVRDYASATRAAQIIFAKNEQIIAQATAMAESSSSTLAESSITTDIVVEYVDVSGSDDILVVNSTGKISLDCSSVGSESSAQVTTY